MPGVRPAGDRDAVPRVRPVTPEQIAEDYRRMADSAIRHDRWEWAHHWDAKAAEVLRTRKIRLTPEEQHRARLEQADALRSLRITAAA